MKHLLIILISILLLSSPVIGDNHKGETLYLLKNPSGDGYIWKGFGDKETQPKYQGNVKDEIPNGLGILIFPNGDKYVGGWKDGKRNGQGRFTYTKGRKYVGEWKDDKYYLGTYTFTDGGKVTGEWKNQMIWKGTQYDKYGNIKYKYVYGETE